jgi:hypothetical protein
VARPGHPPGLEHGPAPGRDRIASGALTSSPT